MMREMLHVLEFIYQNECDNESSVYRHADALQEGVKSRTYQTLMSRTKCSKHSIRYAISRVVSLLIFLFVNIIDSLENRIAHYAKKRRIEIVNKDELEARKSSVPTSIDDDGNE